MINLEFIENCAKHLSLLFRIENDNTKLQFFDIMDALYICEEIIVNSIGSNPVTEDNIHLSLDVCANALIMQFELEDDLCNTEARAIMSFIDQLLTGYLNTADEINQPSTWNCIRDAIENEFCNKDPYTDQLDITISTRTLEKRLVASLSEYCILHPQS